MVFHDHRRDGGEVLQLLVGDLFAPALLAVFGIQGDEPSIGREEVKPVTIHGDAALAYQMAALVFEIELPELFAGTRADGEYVIRNREVQNVVDQQGS